MSLSLLQMMAGVSTGTECKSVCVDKPPSSLSGNSNAKNTCNWVKYFEDILQSEFKDGNNLGEDLYGMYKIDITDTKYDIDTYYIEINATIRQVRREMSPGQQDPDVSVTVSSEDLYAILEGSLAPLNAYLTEQISVNGDIRKLMLLDKLSRRNNKPGRMFDV